MLASAALNRQLYEAVVRLFAAAGLLMLVLVPGAVEGKPKKMELPPNVDTIEDPGGTGDAFQFGPGDRLYIKIFRHPELDTEILIAPDGTMTFPLIGRIEAAGLDYNGLIAILETGLHEYYTDASVSVNILSVENQKIFVVGEVLAPGVLQITGDMSVLEALTRTGGINANARTKNLVLLRAEEEGPQLYTLDVERLLMGDASQNIPLQAEDVLIVPSKNIVNVERFFRHLSTIMGPITSVSQIYRNLNLTSPNVIEDAPSAE